jgi:hypothetical protein
MAKADAFMHLYPYRRSNTSTSRFTSETPTGQGQPFSAARVVAAIQLLADLCRRADAELGSAIPGCRCFNVKR